MNIFQVGQSDSHRVFSHVFLPEVLSLETISEKNESSDKSSSVGRDEDQESLNKNSGESLSLSESSLCEHDAVENADQGNNNNQQQLLSGNATSNICNTCSVNSKEESIPNCRYSSKNASCTEFQKIKIKSTDVLYNNISWHTNVGKPSIKTSIKNRKELNEKHKKDNTSSATNQSHMKVKTTVNQKLNFKEKHLECMEEKVGLKYKKGPQEVKTTNMMGGEQVNFCDMLLDKNCGTSTNDTFKQEATKPLPVKEYTDTPLISAIDTRLCNDHKLSTIEAFVSKHEASEKCASLEIGIHKPVSEPGKNISNCWFSESEPESFQPVLTEVNDTSQKKLITDISANNLRLVDAIEMDTITSQVDLHIKEKNACCNALTTSYSEFGDTNINWSCEKRNHITTVFDHKNLRDTCVKSDNDHVEILWLFSNKLGFDYFNAESISVDNFCCRYSSLVDTSADCSPPLDILADCSTPLDILADSEYGSTEITNDISVQTCSNLAFKPCIKEANHELHFLLQSEIRESYTKSCSCILQNVNNSKDFFRSDRLYTNRSAGCIQTVNISAQTNQEYWKTIASKSIDYMGDREIIFTKSEGSFGSRKCFHCIARKSLGYIGASYTNTSEKIQSGNEGTPFKKQKLQCDKLKPFSHGRNMFDENKEKTKNICKIKFVNDGKHISDKNSIHDTKQERKKNTTMQVAARDIRPITNICDKDDKGDIQNVNLKFTFQLKQIGNNDNDMKTNTFKIMQNNDELLNLMAVNCDEDVVENPFNTKQTYTRKNCVLAMHCSHEEVRNHITHYDVDSKSKSEKCMLKLTPHLQIDDASMKQIYDSKDLTEMRHRNHVMDNTCSDTSATIFTMKIKAPQPAIVGIDVDDDELRNIFSRKLGEFTFESISSCAMNSEYVNENYLEKDNDNVVECDTEIRDKEMEKKCHFENVSGEIGGAEYKYYGSRSETVTDSWRDKHSSSSSSEIPTKCGGGYTVRKAIHMFWTAVKMLLLYGQVTMLITLQVLEVVGSYQLPESEWMMTSKGAIISSKSALYQNDHLLIPFTPILTICHGFRPGLAFLTILTVSCSLYGVCFLDGDKVLPTIVFTTSCLFMDLQDIVLTMAAIWQNMGFHRALTFTLPSWYFVTVQAVLCWATISFYRFTSLEDVTNNKYK